MALWWVVLVAGTLLVFACGGVAVMREFSGRRIPRSGFFARHPREPRWAKAGLLTGVVLVTAAAGLLSETLAGYLAFLVGAYSVASLMQAVLFAWHNRRLAPESEPDPGSTATPRSGDQHLTS